MRRTAKVVRLMRFLCNVLLIHISSYRLHTVHHTHVAVDDADALLGGAGVFFAAFPDLDAADEKPHDFRRQFADFRIPLGLFDKRFHVGGGILKLFQPGFLLENGSSVFPQSAQYTSPENIFGSSICFGTRFLC